MDGKDGWVDVTFFLQPVSGLPIVYPYHRRVQGGSARCQTANTGRYRLLYTAVYRINRMPSYIFIGYLVLVYSGQQWYWYATAAIKLGF